MKERIIKDLPMLIGFIIAMAIVDVISNDSFDVMKMLLRTIVTIAVYLIFQFIEFKKKK